MNFSEHSSHLDSRASNGVPKHAGAEETLCTERIQVERKTFVFTLKENPRGRFLRITEEVGGRRDSVIVPSSGLEDFKRVLDLMLETDGAESNKRSPGMFED